MNTEQHSSNRNTFHEEPVTRRQLLLGMLAAGGTIAVTAAGIKKDGFRESNDREVKATPGTEAVPGSAEDSDFYQGRDVRDPETIRLIAENEPFERLVKAFQIPVEQAGTPELFAEEYAARLEMALNSGIHETAPGEEYDAKIGRYDLAAARGIYGLAGTELEIAATVQYQTLKAAHAAVLKRGHAVSVGVSDSKPIVYKGRSTDDRQYFVTINLEVSSETEREAAAVIATGPVSLGVNTETADGACIVSMDPTVRPLFEQIAAKG